MYVWLERFTLVGNFTGWRGCSCCGAVTVKNGERRRMGNLNENYVEHATQSIFPLPKKNSITKRFIFEAVLYDTVPRFYC